MKDELLHKILSIPTYTKHEELVRDFLVEYGKEKEYLVNVDKKGNVYFTKGSVPEGKYFPCVSAHIDTVFDEHRELIEKGFSKTIVEEDGIIKAYNPIDNKQTGIGADDLAGVFACLKTFEEVDNIKGAFFVEEECGLHGSYQCDKKFFNNVGYFIQYDNPTGYWYSVRFCGTRLYSDYFDTIVKPINESYGITYYCEYDSFSDALPIREQFNICTVDLPIGYYDYHTSEEYLNVEEVFKGIEVGVEYIKALGNEKYEMITVKEEEEENRIREEIEYQKYESGYTYKRSPYSNYVFTGNNYKGWT